MPKSSGDSWNRGGGELARIEFRSLLTSGNRSSRDTLEDAAQAWLVGQSAALERLRSRATAVGLEGSAVLLIHGEPGSGKLRVARWMHRCGNRSIRSLLVLDADDPSLDSALDHVLAALRAPDGPAGAPGMIALRRCERATERTLERLAQILDAQGVELICSLCLISKHGPERLRAAAGLGLGPLLARASGAVVSVPALRHRGGDVADLARVFANEAARRYDKPIRGVSPQALSKLEAHDFPGNVRELQAMVEQAILRSSGDWVTAECFPGLGGAANVSTSDASELVIRLPGSSLREIEIEALRLALKLSGGRIVRASELLGITRHALRRKLEKFGLNELRA